VAGRKGRLRGYRGWYGGMGPQAQDLSQQNGISVVLGAMESDPEKAVLGHINGTLFISDNVCNHNFKEHDKKTKYPTLCQVEYFIGVLG